MAKSNSSAAVLDEPAVAAQPPVENRTYRVLKGQVGPWNAKDPNGNSFSMEQFKSVTALPSIRVKQNDGTYQTTTVVPQDHDPETYWEGLIERLVVLGVIRHEPGLITPEIPLGPECGPRYATLNNSQHLILKEATAIAAQKPLEGTLASGERHRRVEPSELGAPSLCA